MSENLVCTKCNSSNVKQGKFFGIAGLHPLAAKTGIGGSDVIVTFCADCGEILSMKVKNPENFK